MTSNPHSGMMVTNNIVNNIFIAQTPDFEGGPRFLQAKKKKIVKKKKLNEFIEEF
jgi:hypothetical protein